jgi:hypothetical protein
MFNTGLYVRYFMMQISCKCQVSVIKNFITQVLSVGLQMSEFLPHMWQSGNSSSVLSEIVTGPHFQNYFALSGENMPRNQTTECKKGKQGRKDKERELEVSKEKRRNKGRKEKAESETTSTGVSKFFGLATWSKNCKWYSSVPRVHFYRYFLSQSSDFCRHNPLFCFSTSVLSLFLISLTTQSGKFWIYPRTQGYELDDRGSRFRFTAGAGNFSLYHRVQNGSGAHPASYPMGTRGSFLGGKAAGA